MFDVPELPLDTELVKWYIHRKSQRISMERKSQYSVEISSLLGNNMHETMDFMETCSDEELDWLCEELHFICTDFSYDSEFIEFLKELAEQRPNCKDFCGELELVLESIEEEKIDDIFEEIEEDIRKHNSHSMIIKMNDGNSIPDEILSFAEESFTNYKIINNQIHLKTDDIDEISVFFYTLRDHMNIPCEFSKNFIEIKKE